MKQPVPVKILRSGAALPTYGTAYAAGADLYACLDAPVTVEPLQTAVIPTGLAMELPEGFAGLIYARSGLAVKRGLSPVNGVGVIDADYRGEIMVALYNHSSQPQTIRHGERIAQMIVTPFLCAQFRQADELSDTVRGAGGFGSTGV